MDEAELEDWEYPEPDADDDDEFDVIACHNCGREIFEDSEQCPICQHYIVSSGRPAAATSKLGWLGLLIAILLLILLIFGSL